MKSNRTKQLQKRLATLRILDVVILALPVLVYFVIGMASGEMIVVKKVALLGSFVAALALTGLNVIFKFHLKSPIWILLLGIYYAIGNILPLIVILAISTILDELLLSPAIKRNKMKLISNREIDKREESE